MPGDSPGVMVTDERCSFSICDMVKEKSAKMINSEEFKKTGESQRINENIQNLGIWIIRYNLANIINLTGFLI